MHCLKVHIYIFKFFLSKEVKKKQGSEQWLLVVGPRNLDREEQTGRFNGW
jgi:hypothetical protein